MSPAVRNQVSYAVYSRHSQSPVVSWATRGCADILKSLLPALNTIFSKTFSIHLHGLWQSCKYLFRIFQSLEEGGKKVLWAWLVHPPHTDTHFCFSAAQSCLSCTVNTCCLVCFRAYYTFCSLTFPFPLTLLSCQLSDRQTFIMPCVCMTIPLSSVLKVIHLK